MMIKSILSQSMVAFIKFFDATALDDFINFNPLDSVLGPSSIIQPSFQFYWHGLKNSAVELHGCHSKILIWLISSWQRRYLVFGEIYLFFLNPEKLRSKSKISSFLSPMLINLWAWKLCQCIFGSPFGEIQSFYTNIPNIFLTKLFCHFCWILITKCVLFLL